MFGLSDHDLMFSQGAAAGDDQDVEDSFPCPENDYIQHRVREITFISGDVNVTGHTFLHKAAIQ